MERCGCHCMSATSCTFCSFFLYFIMTNPLTPSNNPQSRSIFISISMV
uniref:Uncharacterized protein n=1 Tax=Arundo donax TaxID=35708 RepID=A0A0A9BTQ2_ARUDO